MESSHWAGWPNVEDESVVLELLSKKMRRPLKNLDGIGEVDDIFAIDPWDAAAVDNRCAGNKWFFSKNAGSFRFKDTRKGYWVQTGSPESMNDGVIKVGKRTYTFHLGRRPTAKLTEWTVAEYISQVLAKTQKESVVLCCLYSPKNQYAMDTTSD